MSRWVVGTSLRVAVAVLVAAVAIIVLGAYQLRHVSVDTLPEFGLPQVQVQTEALGLSAAEVEQLITVPLEDEFNGLPFLDTLRSQSLPNLSDIELTFQPGTDVFRARQLVTERVAQGPSIVNVGTPPVMIEPQSSTSRVMMIGLSSSTVSPVDVSTVARWRVRPRLLAVPGVANVTIWGQRDQQLQVLVDPARLQKSGVSLDQVINTTGDAMWTSPLTFVEASSPGADGFIDTPNQRISLQHILPITKPQDLAQVPIEDTTGKQIKLGDVTTVVEDHPALRGDAVLPGSGTGFLLVVEKLPGANTLQVTEGVRDAMEALEPGLTGITVDMDVFQPANYIRSALHNVGWAALAGLLLVMTWLGVAWRSWRVALIAFVAITLSYVAAMLVLYARGTTFNALVLTGLAAAIGVLVDDIAHGVDGLRRGLVARRADDEPEPTKAAMVRDAVTAARRPLGYALAIVAIALVPIWLLDGFSGAFSRPLVLSYALAFIASTLVALIVTPVLGYLLLPVAPPESRADPIATAVAQLVDRLVPSGARAGGPRWAFIAAGVLALAALAIIPQVGRKTVIPTLADRNLVVAWHALPATSLPEMRRLATSAADELRGVPGVAAASTNVGQALFGDQIVDVNSANTWITMKPEADYAKTYDAIRRVVNGYPGIAHTLSSYPALSIADAHADTAGAPLSVRLYGTNYDMLRTEADQIRQIMAGVPGVRDVAVNLPDQQPAISIDVNVANAAKYGLKPGDIRRSSAVLIGGIPVGSYYQNQQVYDVAVWSEPAVRDNLTAIQNLLIDTPDGKQVPLKNVADVSIKPAPDVVRHDSVSRYVDITANVTGSATSAVDRIRDKLESVPLPLGYHAAVASALGDRRADDKRTIWYSIAALIAIYLLLQAAFRSWGRAALVFVSLPLAVAGGALTSLIAGGHFTTGAYAGLLAVFAIAVRNGLRTVRRAQEFEATGLTGPEAAARATRETAYPVVVTAVGVALAVLPLLLRGTVAGMEFLRPLALVVIGGLVTSTIVAIGVLPALYGWIQPGGTEPVAQPAGGADPTGTAGRPDETGDETRMSARPTGLGGYLMRRRRARLVAPFAVVALLAAALLSGCAGTGDEAGEDPTPAKLVAIPGQADLHKVILTPAAVGQIGVKTSEVRAIAAPTTTAASATPTAAPSAKPLTELPVTAVIYDPGGRSWTYTVLSPNTYLRMPITVDHVTGDDAFLSAGPPVGTAVVVQGAPELLGAEYGVGEE